MLVIHGSNAIEADTVISIATAEDNTLRVTTNTDVIWSYKGGMTLKQLVRDFNDGKTKVTAAKIYKATKEVEMDAIEEKQNEFMARTEEQLGKTYLEINHLKADLKELNQGQTSMLVLEKEKHMKEIAAIKRQHDLKIKELESRLSQQGRSRVSSSRVAPKGPRGHFPTPPSSVIVSVNPPGATPDTRERSVKSTPKRAAPSDPCEDAPSSRLRQRTK